MTGPVQVLVLGLDRASFSGEVLTELDRLRGAGIVRLLDVTVVSHREDGSMHTLDPPPKLPGETGRVAAAFFGRSSDEAAVDEELATDNPGDGEWSNARWSLADAIPVGGTAAVALIEHIWAIPLRDAIGRSGGVLLDETWLALEDVDRITGLMKDPL